MKYTHLRTTRSQLLRRARRQLLERGIQHVLLVSVRAIAVRGRRLLIMITRYARWATLIPIPAGTFTFQGEEYRYFRHPYNATWGNERAVEVPIVRHAIEEAGDARILEVGNVLGHYLASGHDVVDKYEPGPTVVNTDILEFRPDQPYDLIVSVSTLEHVGWDDDEVDSAKIPRAIEHLRSLLAPKGRAIVTLPLGYNPYLDEMFRAGTLGFDDECCLLRLGRAEWREVEKAVLGQPAYGKPFRAANGLVIGMIGRSV